MDSQYRLRIDDIGRIYTVINMPDDVLKYGEGLSYTKVQGFLKQFGGFLRQENMSEYVTLRNVRMIDEINYLVVFGFAQIDQLKLVQSIITLFVGTVICTVLFVYNIGGLYFPTILLMAIFLIFFNSENTNKTK